MNALAHVVHNMVTKCGESAPEGLTETEQRILERARQLMIATPSDVSARLARSDGPEDWAIPPLVVSAKA